MSETLTQNALSEQEARQNLGEAIDLAAYNGGEVEDKFHHSYAGQDLRVMAPHDRVGQQEVLGYKNVQGAYTGVEHAGEAARTQTQARVKYEEQFSDQGRAVENTKGLSLITDTDSGKRIITHVELSGNSSDNTQAMETRIVDGERRYVHEMTPRRVAAAKRLTEMNFGLKK